MAAIAATKLAMSAERRLMTQAEYTALAYYAQELIASSPRHPHIHADSAYTARAARLRQRAYFRPYRGFLRFMIDDDYHGHQPVLLQPHFNKMTEITLRLKTHGASRGLNRSFSIYLL